MFLIRRLLCKCLSPNPIRTSVWWWWRWWSRSLKTLQHNQHNTHNVFGKQFSQIITNELVVVVVVGFFVCVWCRIVSSDLYTGEMYRLCWWNLVETSSILRSLEWKKNWSILENRQSSATLNCLLNEQLYPVRIGRRVSSIELIPKLQLNRTQICPKNGKLVFSTVCDVAIIFINLEQKKPFWTTICYFHWIDRLFFLDVLTSLISFYSVFCLQRKTI